MGIPEDKVFCYWKSLKSDDRFPQLKADMKVELGLHPYKSKSAPGKSFVRAKNITMPGGANIAIQDDLDAEKKSFVGGQHLRYTGTCNYYSVKRDAGKVTIDKGYAMEEAVPESIRVEQAEVNCGGKQPFGMKEVLALATLKQRLEKLHTEFQRVHQCH